MRLIKTIFILHLCLSSAIAITLHAQEDLPFQKTIIILENLETNYFAKIIRDDFGKKKLDSIFKSKNIELTIRETTSPNERDSLISKNKNVIYISSSWQKCVGDRHCFGDWTTGLVWKQKLNVQIHREKLISDYKLTYSIKNKLDWLYKTYMNSAIHSDYTASQIHIKNHSFLKYTKSYLDSIRNEGMILSFSPFIHSNSIRLEPIGILKDSILYVSYEYIETESSKIIKNESRKYLIDEKK